MKEFPDLPKRLDLYAYLLGIFWNLMESIEIVELFIADNHNHSVICDVNLAYQIQFNPKHDRSDLMKYFTRLIWYDEQTQY